MDQEQANQRFPGRDVYCHGRLLECVQNLHIFPDSKTFVDMPMKQEPAIINQAFEQLLRATGDQPSKGDVEKFLSEYFTEPGDELESWKPSDWEENPSWFRGIKNEQYKSFCVEMNKLWFQLGRKIKTSVDVDPDRHSLLYLPHPFIAPGDRFREVYYWDSYWIVEGLLLCGMRDTARRMIENLLHLVSRLGFIPNGGRIYYLNRSQPPLLIPMVDAYYERSGDIMFLKQYLPILEKEYSFWTTHRSVEVTTDNGATYSMARYAVDNSRPRPEGYNEDVALTEGMTDEQKQTTYRNLASACESGQDFSTRWLPSDVSSLGDICTSDIIPVDLNVFLYWNETLLAKFGRILGEDRVTKHYVNCSEQRLRAIECLLWNADDGIWYDYHLKTKAHRRAFYPSNIFPLFVDAFDKKKKSDIVNKVLSYIEKHRIIEDYPGGVPSSTISSGQQWDLPNAWPPHVHLFIKCLQNTGDPKAQQMALTITQNWLKSNHKAFLKYKQMFEKYDAVIPGQRGGGGEYEVQTGFGWSNAVVLLLVNEYKDKLEPV